MIHAGLKMEMTVLLLASIRELIQRKFRVMSDEQVSRKDTCQQNFSRFSLSVEMYVLL